MKLNYKKKIYFRLIHISPVTTKLSTNAKIYLKKFSLLIQFLLLRFITNNWPYIWSLLQCYIDRFSRLNSIKMCNQRLVHMIYSKNSYWSWPLFRIAVKSQLNDSACHHLMFIAAAACWCYCFFGVRKVEKKVI